MKRFLFLNLFLVSLFIPTMCFANAPTFTPRELKPLPYAYNALVPYIDEETMILHHDKHYKSYLDKLNKAIEGYPDLYACSISDLLTCLDCLPSEVAKSIKNNGGGVYNHEFFFDIMSNNKTTLSKELKKAILRDFKSFDSFKETFKNTATNLFGSGWTWLVSDNLGNLSILTTQNQDTPITLGLKPIIGIDLWEHAYYLFYKNNRSNYIENWFNVIDWDKANQNYVDVIK